MILASQRGTYTMSAGQKWLLCICSAKHFWCLCYHQKYSKHKPSDPHRYSHSAISGTSGPMSRNPLGRFPSDLRFWVYSHIQPLVIILFILFPGIPLTSALSLRPSNSCWWIKCSTYNIANSSKPTRMCSPAPPLPAENYCEQLWPRGNSYSSHGSV